MACVGQHLGGLEKLAMQARLTFAVLKLKKVANWTWIEPKLDLEEVWSSLNSRERFNENSSKSKKGLE